VPGEQHTSNTTTHPKVASERLGHATISITLDTYSHAIPAMQGPAAWTARLGLVHVGQVFGFALLRRRADDQDNDLSVALVAKLQGGLGLDDGDGAAWGLDPHGRVAKEKCRAAFEDDEHLLLNVFEVAGAACAGRQAPDVGAHVVKGP
jgi:hypothetical protein